MLDKIEINWNIEKNFRRWTENFTFQKLVQFAADAAHLSLRLETGVDFRFPPPSENPLVRLCGHRLFVTSPTHPASGLMPAVACSWGMNGKSDERRVETGLPDCCSLFARRIPRCLPAHEHAASSSFIARERERERERLGKTGSANEPSFSMPFASQPAITNKIPAMRRRPRVVWPCHRDRDREYEKNEKNKKWKNNVWKITALHFTSRLSTMFWDRRPLTELPLHHG